MGREPLELASEDDLALYAAVFGLDRDLVQRARRCPDCEAPILACDNGWLDAKPSPDGDCGVMKMGPFIMFFGGGDPNDPGSRHTLHQHQPEETT